MSFADGLWLGTAPVRFLGLRLTVTMAVLRLADGTLLVHSPLVLTPERRAAVEALGRVAHLYAPNLQHHSWIGEWVAAFPSARVHAPARLAKKRPDLRVDRVHGDGLEPAFGDYVSEIPIEGCRLGETVLLYRPARTLIVADLAHNVGRPGHPWTASYAHLMGFYDRVAISRALRWTAFSDRRAACRSLDDVLGRPFDRLVVGHGEPIATNGREALAAAYSWLRSR
jgi:hypothetical protein